MPSHIKDGVKCVTNDVLPGAPVKFHQHNKGHWFICCKDVIDLETENHGTFRLLPGQTKWVEANEMHKVIAVAGPAAYACAGLEGF